jgi:hypothetical protein
MAQLFLCHVDFIQQLSNGCRAFLLGVAQGRMRAANLLQSKILARFLLAHLNEERERDPQLAPPSLYSKLHPNPTHS